MSLLGEYPKRYPLDTHFQFSCLFTAINDVSNLLTFTWAAGGLEAPFNLRH